MKTLSSMLNWPWRGSDPDDMGRGCPIADIPVTYAHAARSLLDPRRRDAIRHGARQRCEQFLNLPHAGELVARSWAAVSGSPRPASMEGGVATAPPPGAPTVDRRECLKVGGAVVGCLLLGREGRARTGETAFTLWQLPGQTRSQMNSYVIRTAGNEVIVIDGGTRGDAAYLAAFIRDMGNHVHAWFVTHPHRDHVDALTAILKNPGGMRIDTIYGLLPDDGWLKEHQDGDAFRAQQELKAALEKARHELQELKPGQTITFTDTTFTILSGLNPEITVNAVNNQSIVWRVDGGGTSVLFLADLGEEGGEKLLAGEYRKWLGADYVQMAHHGQTGVSELFYREVNPKYCLWPTPDWLWENDGGSGPGSGPWKTLEVRAWMENLNIQKHYVAKDGLHRIDIARDPD